MPAAAVWPDITGIFTAALNDQNAQRVGRDRLQQIRWLTPPRSAADFSAIGLVALPVLVEGDVEVCRLLRGVVLVKDSAGTWDLPSMP